MLGVFTYVQLTCYLYVYLSFSDDQHCKTEEAFYSGNVIEWGNTAMGETDIQPCPNATGRLKLCRPCHVRMQSPPPQKKKSFNLLYSGGFQYILMHKV